MYAQLLDEDITRISEQLIDTSYEKRETLAKRMLGHVFVCIDRDSTGELNSSELFEFRQTLRRLGHVEKEVTLADHKRVFSNVDSDNDGKISVKEFSEYMFHHLPIAAAPMRTELENYIETAQELVAHWNARTDKRASLGQDGVEGFLEAEARAKARLEQLFRAVDIDSSGEVDKSELFQLRQTRRTIGQATQEVSQRQHERLFGQIDCDGDGTISMSEFVEFFYNRLPFEATAQAAWFDEMFQAAAHLRQHQVQKAVDFFVG